MPRPKRLQARIDQWVEFAAQEDGDQLVGCSACGKVFDIREIRARLPELAPWRLPCRHAVKMFPLSTLRHPETYGL